MLRLVVVALGAGLASSVSMDQVLRERNADPVDRAVHGVGGPWDSLTPAEFKSRVLLPPRPAPRGAVVDAHRRGFTAQAGVPEAFDWRDEGAVTEVKDQGTLGTCWAFSTVGAVEGQLALQHQVLTNLSVEQLVECDASNDAEAGWADCGVFGGWPYLAFQYLVDAGGSWSDADWPYCAYAPRGSSLTQCWPCMAHGYSIQDCGNHWDFYCNASTTMGQGPAGYCGSASGAVAKVQDWEALPTNETDIAAALVEKGPLSVLMNAEKLQFYKNGIYSPSHCNPTDLDHAVLLVGFGVENNTDYWIVKNSWGTGWGEDGYFRILRGAGTCGINTAVTVPSVA